MLKLLFLSLICLYMGGQWALGYPYGMPDNPDTCLRMTPGHTPNVPQSRPRPFDIIVSRDKYRATDSIEVTIRMRGSEKFKGFAIQARRIGPNADRDTPVGFFRKILGTEERCNQPRSIGSPVIGNALTHNNDSYGSQQPKSELTLTWSPTREHGHVEFRVTVVVSFDKYWVMEPSQPIQDVRSTEPLPATTTLSPMSPSHKIAVNECGRTKGCYRNPPNCHPTTCDILVTWRNDNQNEYIEFEMVGATEGWVAVGFSDDLKMGGEDVYECVGNKSSADKVRKPTVAQSRNPPGEKSNYVLTQSSNIEQSDGLIDNGRINCYFRVRSRRGANSFATTKYHLLMAKGLTDEHGHKLRHVLEPGKYPYVSVNKVALIDNVDITSTTRYVLVKVHGILMLIGWMMCSSTALILAKYYKPMWPNNRLCGERIWFAVHRGCMAVNLFATIIAFIVIFIHANGYSQMPDLPAKAHPILGIITTILCVMNPLIALCRCSEKSDKRPIFNWIHWFIGTCATVLATPTMFIGLNLPKAHVPWWATWVMVAFFLFHLIIELLLEIHGCLNASKQKYRTQEYEMRKPRDDREQEPVGKRFKKIVLCIYLVVVICLGLVMIISIIAG